MSETNLNTTRIKLPFAAVDDKPYIFASYAHNDNEIVFPLLKKLYEAGYNVWYDEGITIGERYDNVIKDHIEKSAVFLFFTSNLSVSRSYIIEKELPVAFKNRDYCTILTLYIEKKVAVPENVAAMLPKKHLKSIEQVIRKLRKLQIIHYGERKAVPIERDVPKNWYDGHETDPLNGALNNVFCNETPYACLVFHPHDMNACNPYTKELYFAGYNVRSCEYGTDRDRSTMISDPDCMAYVPFVTKRYAESGMLQRDYEAAKNAGKKLIWLNFPTIDANGKEEWPDESFIPDEMMQLQGLNLHRLTENDFLSELESNLEKINCYAARDADGKVARRSFDIKDFFYDFTENQEGIIITKLKEKTERIKNAQTSTVYETPARETSFFEKLKNKVMNFFLGDNSTYTGSVTNTVANVVARSDITDIVIKSSYSGYPVLEIGERAFYGCKSILSVTIEDGVEMISKEAFGSCYGLRSVRIPGSVRSIGIEAFDGCWDLTSVDIEYGVRNIGFEAFGYCTKLPSINLPESVISMDSSAFTCCSKLKAFRFPSGITKIPNDCLCECGSLKSVEFPGRVTSIGERAFLKCASLSSIHIPDSVTEIGCGALAGCSSLRSVTIPAGVTYIELGLFTACSSLTSVTILGSVTSIGVCAFFGCSSLTSVTIPGNVKHIGLEAFAKCSNLHSVTIRGSVEGIEDRTFYECGKLTSVEIPKGAKSIGEEAFYGCGSLTSVTIPRSVKSIGDGAFHGCGQLSSVEIPGRVTGIGHHTFCECETLRSVMLPRIVTSIGDKAFYRCGSLSTLKIPDHVKSIGDYAFSDCRGLTSITLPDGTESLGENVFYECSSLTSIKIPESVTTIGDRAFLMCGVTIIGTNILVGEWHNDLVVHCVRGSTAWNYCEEDKITCSPILSKKQIHLITGLIAAGVLLVAAVGARLLGLFG